MQRIDVYKDDEPSKVVQFFCKKHGLSSATEKYLGEKVQMYKSKAQRKKKKDNQAGQAKKTEQKSVKIVETTLEQI